MVIWVGVGAGLGAVLRYVLTMAGKIIWPEAPWMTMIINLLGAVVAGFFSGIIPDSALRIFLLTGVCGGLTTFSTYMTDSFILIRNREFGVALVYYFGTAILGVVGLYLGLQLGQLF